MSFQYLSNLKWQGFMGTSNLMFHAPNFNFNCTKYLFSKNTKLIILEPNKIIEHLKNKYEVNRIIYLNNKINKLTPISVPFAPF